MSKQLDWLKYGQTVTATRMKEAKAAKLPDAVMALLWENHTINAEDMAIISKAMNAKPKSGSRKPKPKSKQED